MTSSEREELRIKYSNEMLKQNAIIAESDRHVWKCMKLGLTFKDEYPEEYQQYVEALAAYHEAENALEEVEAAEVEEAVAMENGEAAE